MCFRTEKSVSKAKQSLMTGEKTTGILVLMYSMYPYPSSRIPPSGIVIMASGVRQYNREKVVDVLGLKLSKGP